MILLLVIFAIAGLVLASEYFMSRSSKWDVLCQKSGNASLPSNGWQACKFLRMEIREGNHPAASWKKTWLYSAVVESCRRALPYLAFPSGSFISVAEDGKLELFLNEKKVQIRKGSYLDLVIERSQHSAN